MCEGWNNYFFNLGDLDIWEPKFDSLIFTHLTLSN
jgi:hypothetical protein